MRNKDVVIAEEQVDMEELMGEAEGSRFRALAARLNYLAMDRSDMQFAAKECCRRMAKPRLGDWTLLKRAGRYLRGRPRCIQAFPFEDYKKCLKGFGDSDWAGEKPGRKSTSGGAVMLGGSMLKSWSTSQSVIALSSGEAELYALMRLATQTLGIMSMARDFGENLTAEIQTDSSAAMGMAHRAGLGGKSRHIDVQFLWIQDCIKSKEVKLAKVHTDDNLADVLTKYLGKESFEKHLKAMGYTWREGRASEGRNVACQGRSEPEDTRARRGISICNVYSNYENIVNKHSEGKPV